MSWATAFAIFGISIGFGSIAWAVAWMVVEENRERTKRFNSF